MLIHLSFSFLCFFMPFLSLLSCLILDSLLFPMFISSLHLYSLLVSLDTYSSAQFPSTPAHFFVLNTFQFALPTNHFSRSYSLPITRFTTSHGPFPFYLHYFATLLPTLPFPLPFQILHTTPATALGSEKPVKILIFECVCSKI